ncbi:MAG: ATP-binding protein [Candidatus Omnitrophota bacterium]
MTDPRDQNNQLAHELGKIYQSFLDKGLLCDFFVENTAALAGASTVWLLLSGHENQLWTASCSEPGGEFPAQWRAEVQAAYEKGQPVRGDRRLWIPLIVRNSALGILAVLRREADPPFSDDDYGLACNLTFQMASALKNLLLFEQNVKMERLAAIGQTVGVVLHEVKNIIQLATFSQEYLRIGIEKKKEDFLTRGLNGIKRATREMDGFVYEMLSLTKDYKISPEPFKVQTLLEELQADLGEKAHQYGVRLECEIDKDFPEAQGEPRSLFRALLNLVKNAMEASDTKKTESFVRVRVRRKDRDRYQILVEDNGLGMSEEVRARIFQAFFTTKGERGTGLGLMIIDRTIQAHHGELSLASRPGEGTAFTLTLPFMLPAA